MPRFAAVLALLLSTLVVAGSSAAAVRVGVADDFGTHGDQTAWFFDHLGELGMAENRVSVVCHW